MTRVAAALRGFGSSLAGRIALILAVGTALAAAGAVMVAEQAGRANFRRIQAERVVASATDVITRLERDPLDAEVQLRGGQLSGANMVTPGQRVAHQVNPMITRLLADRMNGKFAPTLSLVSPQLCMALDPFWRRPRAAGFHVVAVPECWLLTLDRPQGRTLIALYLPQLPPPPSIATNPVFLSLTALAIIVLSILAARLATAPLRRLTRASEAFARSIDAEPVPASGPSDVAEALATFNLMQERVRDGLRERTRILAAISHDLQTPLTRLRLRLEQVEDEALRERLIADLSTTLAMVKRGLDLARSGESAESWSVMDLDSLLSSIADDAAEFGHRVTFHSGCGARVRTKPDSLTRCITNLVDNALKYGGDAEIACRRDRNEVVITVRDHGPGMDASLLPRAFEPFVRGDTSRSSGDGSGIGLPIARAQAAAIGGTIDLRNHPDGGLEATLRLPA